MKYKKKFSFVTGKQATEFTEWGDSTAQSGDWLLDDGEDKIVKTDKNFRKEYKIDSIHD